MPATLTCAGSGSPGRGRASTTTPTARPAWPSSASGEGNWSSWSPGSAPEDTSLAQIHAHLVHFKEADIPSVPEYRRQFLLGRMPSFLQRWVLWHKTQTSGERRVKYAGTFALTSYGMLGAESLHPIGPQTTLLTLGPRSAAGEVTVKLIYDHRVFDGMYVARCLNYLGEVLHKQVLAELRAGAGRPA